MKKYDIPECMKVKKDFLLNIVSPSYVGQGLFLGLGPEGHKKGYIKPDILRVVHYRQNGRHDELEIDTVPLNMVEVIRGGGNGPNECENLTLNYKDIKGISSEILTTGWNHKYYKTLLDALIKKAPQSH